MPHVPRNVQLDVHDHEPFTVKFSTPVPPAAAFVIGISATTPSAPTRASHRTSETLVRGIENTCIVAISSPADSAGRYRSYRRERPPLTPAAKISSGDENAASRRYSFASGA